jgi:hypothetical protein
LRVDAISNELNTIGVCEFNCRFKLDAVHPDMALRANYVVAIFFTTFRAFIAEVVAHFFISCRW